jgi:hypothetical protein
MSMRLRALRFMLLLLGAGLATAQTVNIAGTYRCASFNVGGRGGRCTSPPLILRGDGTYQISGEKGRYGVKNGLLVLSASKVRGPGQILGNEIMFEYRYAGLLQTVTAAAPMPRSRRRRPLPRPNPWCRWT